MKTANTFFLGFIAIVLIVGFIQICNGLIGVQKSIYVLASVESARLNREYGFRQHLREGWAEVENPPHSNTNIYIVTTGGWKEAAK